MDEKEQRELLARIREELTNVDASPWSDMEDSWQSLEGNIHYGQNLRKDSGFVLPSITFWVQEIGDYPPPELLIAFVKMFRTYMDAAGSLTLEEVFFGSPKQRLGSYARRCAAGSSAERTEFLFRFAFMRAKKVLGIKSDAKAAEFAQADVEKTYGSCPDAETMLKRIRRKRMRTK